MARSDGEVSVTVMLNGGHSRTLFLGRRDPLLLSLIASIGEKSYGGGRAARPFNIHLDQGRQSFIFSSSDLVGLLTDPPLVTDGGARPAAVSVQPGTMTVTPKSPHVLIENFIEPERHADLLRFVTAREKEFVPSTVSTNDAQYRRSMVLHQFPEFADLVRARVRALMPQLCRNFGLPEFPVADVECQLTAHNDGHFYKLHNDNGSADTLERTLTYVFYFHNEPKAYSGGEFRLYDSRIQDGRLTCGEPAADIEPKNNSILFFPSYCHHEVLPVRCASGRFVDSRFTINGWVRRAKAA
jgi:Rps23 Pro-64 3,4-dihydroxylase Tpa1-like proline 4-hydroxylase